jgi:hypothetical protein
VTQYALHRGYFVKRFPETSLRLAYFVPTLFTIGSVTGWVTWWIWRPLFHLYAAVMVFYLLFVLASSFLAGPRLTLATTLGTILTHYGYGYCFLKGLLARKLSEQEEGGEAAPPTPAAPGSSNQ